MFGAKGETSSCLQLEMTVFWKPYGTNQLLSKKDQTKICKDSVTT